MNLVSFRYVVFRAVLFGDALVVLTSPLSDWYRASIVHQQMVHFCPDRLKLPSPVKHCWELITTTEIHIALLMKMLIFCNATGGFQTEMINVIKTRTECNYSSKHSWFEAEPLMNPKLVVLLWFDVLLSLLYSFRDCAYRETQNKGKTPGKFGAE